MSETINSAQAFRAELADVVRRYVSHLELDAPTELTTVRVEATGPAISIVYAEHGTEPPRLNISINELARPSEEEQQGRGRHR
jgi:hypothetical protein